MFKITVSIFYLSTVYFQVSYQCSQADVKYCNIERNAFGSEYLNTLSLTLPSHPLCSLLPHTGMWACRHADTFLPETPFSRKTELMSGILVRQM